MATIKTTKEYCDSEEQCEILSMIEGVIQGLDMVHCRYALAWNEDDKGWYVEIPIKE